MTRLSLVISDETNRALRAFLANNDGKKGDISAFIEQAVQDRLFRLTVDNVKERNAAFSQDDILSDINEAIEASRAHRT